MGMYWTPMQLRRLKNLVEVNHKGPNDVAQTLDCTFNEAIEKAKELGLTWDPRYVLIPTPSSTPLPAPKRDLLGEE